jgi:hypothetical protein
MSLVSYDPDFDRKVDLGADALLKMRNVAPEEAARQRPTAIQEARMVLLTAMAYKKPE